MARGQKPNPRAAEIVETYRKGSTTEVLKKEFGVSRAYAALLSFRAGVKREMHPPLLKEAHKLIMAEYRREIKKVGGPHDCAHWFLPKHRALIADKKRIRTKYKGWRCAGCGCGPERASRVGSEFCGPACRSAHYQKKRSERAAMSAHRREQALLRNRLKARLHKAFRSRGLRKNGNTIELLGCTLEFFRGWIESKFKKGMSWKNYGQWQFDHLCPVSKFNLLDPEEVRKCFHYTNIQPLWTPANRLKWNLIIPHQPQFLI